MRPVAYKTASLMLRSKTLRAKQTPSASNNQTLLQQTLKTSWSSNNWTILL
jgi:hypothetical protein